MSDYATVKAILARSNFEIARKLYIKTRATSGTLSSWTEIDDERVKSWGTVSKNASEINAVQINSSPLNLVLNNDDGYFNDENDSNSLWSGEMTRYRSPIKIEFAYKDTNGTLYPSNSTVFLGVIGESYTQKDNREIAISVNPWENIVKDIFMTDVRNMSPSAGSVWDARGEIVKIWTAQPPTGTFSLIQEFITTTSIRAYAGRQDYTAGMINTATVGDQTAWGLIRQMAEAEGFKTYFTRDGKLIFGNCSYDDFYKDRLVTSGTGECEYHQLLASASGTLTATVGDGTLTWDGDGTLTAMKFGNGVVGTTSSNRGYLKGTLPTFNPNRFTIEMWVQPFMTVSSGVADSWVRLMDLFVTNTEPNSATVFNYDQIRIGWGTWETITSTQANVPSTPPGAPYQLALYKYNHHRTDSKYYTRNGSSMIYATATAVFSVGSVYFLAFVHDANGIDGTEDIFRIYYAPDGGSLTNISSFTRDYIGRNTQNDFNADNTLGSGDTRTAYLQLAVPDTATATLKCGVENLKIYPYAKLDFSERETKLAYTEREKLRFRGLADERDTEFGQNIMPGIVVSPGLDKVRNYVKVEFSSGSLDYALRDDGQWTAGSSSFAYGVRRHAVSNEFLQSSGPAAIMAQAIYDEYVDPKKEFEIKTKIMPYINVLDETYFTFQTPSTSSGRSLNYDHVKVKVMKASHNLDKMESKFTLREI